MPQYLHPLIIIILIQILSAFFPKILFYFGVNDYVNAQCVHAFHYCDDDDYDHDCDVDDHDCDDDGHDGVYAYGVHINYYHQNIN